MKGRYVKMMASGRKVAALGLKYIERDSVEKDGSKGVLYDANGPVDRHDFAEPRKGEQRQYRLIISPEDGEQLDLTAYARTFMSRVERDLGQKLEWAAVTDDSREHSPCAASSGPLSGTTATAFSAVLREIHREARPKGTRWKTSSSRSVPTSDFCRDLAEAALAGALPRKRARRTR